MKKTDQTLQLVVLDDSSNHAETVSNMLRNSGHAVRATRVEDGEDLRKTLLQHATDMVLAKLTLPYLPVTEAIDIIRELQLDTPLIVLEDNSDPQAVLQCLAAGARDAVSLTVPARLEHVVMREHGDLLRRRRLVQCERLLAEANERAQGLVDTSRDAIAYAHEGMHIYANESYLQMFGFTGLGEIEGMPLMNMVSPEDHGQFKEFLRRMSKDKEQKGAMKLRAIRANGSEFQVNMEFSPTSYAGEECTQIVIRDESMSKELEKKLKLLSSQDLLTTLFNRQYFLDSLKSTLTGSANGALLYMEPDQFRRVRDEVGIAASDLLIADLAAVFKRIISDSSAVLARFDSYTFTAILPGVEPEYASALAQKLVKEMESHVANAGARTVTLTASVGISIFNETINDSQEVLSRAERARRSAAESGGNRAEIYNPGETEMADKERALVWTKRLKTALRDNSFFLVYQPIVNLQGGGDEKYEVFVRMSDEGKEVDPIEFIAVAERTGLMVAIDRWVLHHAVKTIAERARAGKQTSLFVNMSESSVKDPNFVPWLRELLKAARLDGSCLTIEVAENAALSSITALKTMFEGLEALKVQTAIDHFGVAPNALNLLRHVTAKYIKVDGSVVNGIARNPQQQAQLREISAAVREVKGRTVAEFVEDANTLASLFSCGVEYIQGYFLQRPSRELNYDFSGEGH